MKKDKIKLREIEVSSWRYILYETTEGQLIGDFIYSPKSWVDLSLLMSLTKEEQQQVEADRSYLLKLSDDIRNNFKDYLGRGLNREEYIFME